ncbi:MAG: hypothetical protein LIO99_06160 [Clostridiales bacterium]|nr:hypothetical protein [Clostridiales bacterium]
MAGKNEYLDEAYSTLLELSADEKKRLEYEAREKALRDYNFGMNCARKEGEQVGEERGIAIGEERGTKKKEKELILSWSANGRSISEIAMLLSLTDDDVLRILEESKKD